MAEQLPVEIEFNITSSPSGNGMCEVRGLSSMFGKKSDNTSCVATRREGHLGEAHRGERRQPALERRERLVKGGKGVVPLAGKRRRGRWPRRRWG